MIAALRLIIGEKSDMLYKKSKKLIFCIAYFVFFCYSI